MLVACRLAGLSALETYYAGTSVGAQFGAACGCAAQLQRLVQMAAKIRRLARNSKLGDDGGSGSRQTQISFPREQDAVSRLGVRSRHLRFPPRSRWLDVASFGRDHSRPLRCSAWRRYHVRRDISSLSQGFLASLVRRRSSIRGRPVRARFIVCACGVHASRLERIAMPALPHRPVATG
jgi:hypothetical protein